MSIRTITYRFFVSISVFLGVSSCENYRELSLPEKVTLSGKEQEIRLRAGNMIDRIEIKEGDEWVETYTPSSESLEGEWYEVSAIRNRKELDVYVSENKTGEPRSIEVWITGMLDAVSTIVTQLPL